MLDAPRLVNGRLTAWGSGSPGETTILSGLSNVVAIATGGTDITGGGTHSLALLPGGKVRDWGDNYYRYANAPIGLNNVVAIAAGTSHSMALLSSPGLVFSGATVRPGDTLTLVAANGEGNPARCQWFFQGTNRIAAAVGPTLTLTNLQPDQIGQYTAVTEFTFGRFTSAVIDLVADGEVRLVVLDAQGPVQTCQISGKIGTGYVVETTTDLTPPVSWQPAFSLVLTNSVGTFQWTNTGETARFFRAQEQ